MMRHIVTINYVGPAMRALDVEARAKEVVVAQRGRAGSGDRSFVKTVGEGA